MRGGDEEPGLQHGMASALAINVACMHADKIAMLSVLIKETSRRCFLWDACK